MVIAEALSIIVRRSTLEEKYPGGFEGYRILNSEKRACTTRMSS
jgi:hypothetical protein